MIRDFNIEYLEKRVWIPWQTFTQQIHSGAQLFESLQSTTSTGVQVASSKMAGLALAAQNDGGATLWMTPYDLDINKQVRFRVHYSQTATSGTATFLINYTQYVVTAAGTAGATVIIAPATALDTVVPAASGTVVANDWRMTGFGIIAKKTILDTAYGLGVKVSCTDASPNAGLAMLGLEIRYSTRKTAGPRRNVLGGRRLLDANPLGATPQKLHATQEGL